MASTYSANLRLELIGTGEQQGTWGNTTNSNLGTLLEQAIGGYESITVSNVSDTTLTTANGSADQARNMTLNLVGTLTATRNVICPSAEKMYIVKNSTTGGFAVTFKVTGQTGVSIPNGATYILYVDGTDARQATGSVASGGTGTTTSTGTGSVVLSASPTLTGVPLSTTAAADTNTTQVATTAYVVGQASSTTPVVDGTATIGTSLRYARADHIHPTDTSRAPLASPSFTGTPLSTTAAANTSTTQIATTAFVIGQANGTAGTIAMNGTQAAGTSALYARADHVHPSDTSRAPLASPTFTGTPLSTTAAVDTNTTQIATTAYVVGQGYLKSATASSTYAPLASPALTGTPTAPTASPGTNTTQVATTAFVQAASSPATGRILRAPQVLTTGTTSYTTPANCTGIYVEMVGGGGGSGATTSPPSGAGGGGGGAYCAKYISVSANTAYTVAIGAAGTAGSGGGNGGNGGDTTITVSATTYTAGGGAGSLGTGSSSPGGNGGVATNGDIMIGGAKGVNGSSSSPFGGAGGLSFWAVGPVTTSFGYGQGGAGDGSATLSTAGKVGSAGIMRIWEYS